MKRYVATSARPVKLDYEDDQWSALKPHLTVYEPTEEPRHTGLIDVQGNPIVCFESKQPIGFGPFRCEGWGGGNAKS